MTSPNDGHFPTGSSILRHVHSQRAVGLLYGQRALMIGALNPIAATWPRDPHHRLLDGTRGVDRR